MTRPLLAALLLGAAFIAPAQAQAPAPQAAAKQAAAAPADAKRTGKPGSDAADPAKSPFGAFLASRFAAREGEANEAANAMIRASDADPSNATLRRDAFALALMAELPDAARLARAMPTTPITALLLADEKVREGDWKGAELAYATLPRDALTDVLRPLLIAWTQQAQGDVGRALETLEPELKGGKLSNFYLLHAALIADLGHRDGLADRWYTESAAALARPNLRVSQLLASWQWRSGRRAQATSTVMALANAESDLAIAIPGLIAGLDRPPVPDARHGIAEVYAGVGAGLRGPKSGDAPAYLLKLAELMQPDLAQARLVSAELASERKQPAAAARELSRVSDTDPLAAEVRLRLAEVKGRAGDTDGARDILEKLATDYPDRPEPLTQLGLLMAQAKRWPDAIRAYDRAVARLPSPKREDWFVFYLRGAAHERSHEWPPAEADMKRALELFPDQPVVLNFLGFSWTERNQNLPEARRMIERALAQRPDDGAIVDSLGWIMLRQGQVPDAVRTLERAAEMEPADPTITGHLGDAYWEAGRHAEAQTQWRRALVMKPDPDETARIQGRLKQTGAD